MSRLPRDPDGPEVAIELRFVVLAHYKLGGCTSSSSNCRSSIEADSVTARDFLSGADVCSGEVLNAERTVGDEEIDAPHARLFLGDLGSWGLKGFFSLVLFLCGLLLGTLIALHALLSAC